MRASEVGQNNGKNFGKREWFKEGGKEGKERGKGGVNNEKGRGFNCQADGGKLGVTQTADQKKCPDHV